MIDLVSEITDAAKPMRQDPGRLRPVNSEVMALLADASRLTAATGWQPHVDLREGLIKTVSWWRTRVASGRVRRETDFMT